MIAISVDSQMLFYNGISFPTFIYIFTSNSSTCSFTVVVEPILLLIDIEGLSFIISYIKALDMRTSLIVLSFINIIADLC